jgi:hypothetical protein
MTDRPTQLHLIEESIDGLSVLHAGHWDTARRFGSMDKGLGVPVVMMTTLVGTTLFATLDASGSTWQIVAGIVAMLAAVLAGLQTFLKYSERSTEHKTAGIRFGDMKREAKVLYAFPPEAEGDLEEQIRALDEEWSLASAASPPIPGKIYAKAKEEYYAKKTKGASP